MEENKENPGAGSPIKILARKLQENRITLHIKRVPDKTKKDFIALAHEEFCGDYGMTLKWLMDDIISKDDKLIIVKLEEHESRIHNLESGTSIKEEPPTENFIKMLNGRKKIVRGLNKNE